MNWARAVFLMFLAFPAAGFPARSQPLQIFLAHAQPQSPESDAVAAAAEAFRDMVETRSQGRISVEIVPNGLLGGNRDMTTLTEKGVIQSALVTIGGATKQYPPLMATQLPFAFENSAQARAVLDGPFVEKMAADMAARSKLTLLGFADPGGFHVLTNLDRDIRNPDEMWGLRLRAIPGFAPLEAMISAVKARPVQVSSRDVLTMLKTGGIDGQFSPSAVVLADGYDAAQRYATVFNILYSPYVWLFNSKALADLSAEDADLVRQAAASGIAAGRELADSIDAGERGLAGLAKRMRVRRLSPTEREEFRAIMQPPVLEAIREALGADQVWMDRFLDEVAKTRK